MIEFKEHSEVELLSVDGDELRICQRARTSTRRGATVAAPYTMDFALSPADEGLVRSLVRERHGAPFEHAQMCWHVRMPIFAAREGVRHRISSWCLAGDTQIYFESEAGNGNWKTIEKHWDDWHNGVPDTIGRRRKLQSVRDAQVRSYDEETLEIRRSRVLDVVQSGMKEVFAMTTSRGFTVKASADHRIYTPSGWRRLGDLVPGHEVYVQCRTGWERGKRRAVNATLRAGIDEWVAGVRYGIFARDEQVCQGCNEWTSDPQCDHVVPVVQELRLALDEANLQTLCPRCHKAKTGREQEMRRFPSSLQTACADVVTGIEPLGPMMTYDLELEGPHRNFLADGVVVHNSEMSGRYVELLPMFWVPPADRPLVKESGSKQMDYKLVPGSHHMALAVREEIKRTSRTAWTSYQTLLNANVAKEVARVVLPLNVYTQVQWTMNVRAITNFLSLRVRHEGSHIESKPQLEIQEVAVLIERDFAEHFPTVHHEWNKNGRMPL